MNAIERSTWLIGTADNCDIIVPGPYASSFHARLTRTERGFVLEDLDSTNGTYVDGVRLPPRQRIDVKPTQTITLSLRVPFPWERVLVPQREPGAPAFVTIGRTEGVDLQVDYPIVSGRHARVDFHEGQYYLSDTNSRNGTAINRVENQISGPALLHPGDVVFLGSYKLPAAEILAQFHKSGTTAIGDANYTTVTFKGDSMVIGRDPGCDQVLDFPMISGRHARMTRTAGGMFVEDLGSRNGTFVDGKRISGSTRIEEGQEIGLGSFRFQMLKGGELAKRFDRGYTIEARGIAVVARNGTPILSAVSFTAFAGELVALMGTSGAGKTTLLKVLNGYTAPSAGTVFYNGKDLYQFYDEYSQKVGYVPQDDIVHERLTVREALSYAARLRTALSETDIAAEAIKVAADLGLTDKLDSIIGSPENKVLSGGQRKRVNIALELMCGTPVLFLDEPTSGLSSADADSVVRLLKRLARESGKTIVTTIHAPSLEAYKEFDNLIMLSRDHDQPGAMVYYGPAYPDSIEFVAHKGAPIGPPIDPNVGPEMLMTALDQKDPPDPQNTTAAWVQRFGGSKYYKQYVVDRAGQNPSGASTATGGGRKGLDFAQWVRLARRNITVRFRDRQQMAILLLQAPIFALLIYAVFGRLPEPVDGSTIKELQQAPHEFWKAVQMAGGIHFLMVVAAVWFGCNNAVRDVVGEWLIYQRERMVCLRLPSYVFSKLIVLSGICLFQVFVMVGIVYPACNLSSGFWPTLGVLWLTSMVGAAIGLLISSAPFCKTTESAIALLPIVLLPMIGLGGGMRPVYQLKTAGVATNFVATRWAFEANLVNEAEKRRGQGEQYNLKDRSKPTSWADIAERAMPRFVKDYEESFENEGSENRSGMKRCIIALAAMFLVGVAGIMFSLKSRDVH